VAVTAVCPGTFDPVTNGHVDIIERAARLLDRLVVAVLENPAKSPLFDVGERVEMLAEATADLRGVEVDSFSGLLVEYADRVGANVIVKGLRAVTDFEYEIQMAQMNQRLGGVETFFMTTDPTWSYLSSSLVREVARFGGDVGGLVPPGVARRLRERLASSDVASGSGRAADRAPWAAPEGA
jgi:pantetheine-phosphate adenylyltransferase